MREAMMAAFMEIAEKDPNFMLLTGDLGFSVFEQFEERFPKQFINVGVSEQNMIGVASGLAAEKKKVFVYSIGNFASLRCLEQIRNDACYHELNVNIIGMGGGFNYGPLGMTHHATEDLSVMQSIPGLSVIAPTSSSEAYCLIKQAVSHPYPTYFRLEKMDDDSPYDSEARIGRLSCSQIGDEEVLLISVGAISANVANAIELLKPRGISAALLKIHSVKPLDHKTIINAAEGKSCVVTIEENNVVGGVGSEIAASLLTNGLAPKFTALGVHDVYHSVVGSQSYLRAQAGISAEKIADAVERLLIPRGNE